MMSLDSIGRIYSILPLVTEYGDNMLGLSVFGGFNLDDDPHPGTIDRE